MIAALLSGKMNITSLSGEFGSMDDRGMSDLAEMGRMEARTQRQQSATPHPGLARYDGWGFPYEFSDRGIAILPVPGTPRRKTGRASCRERVCPSVYISVVTVPLK